MGQYKNILNNQCKEYNSLYNKLNKLHPEFNKEDKKCLVLKKMLTDREAGIDDASSFIDLLKMDTREDIRKLQYILEVFVLGSDIEGKLVRYYIKDENLFEFFFNTEVRKKEVESIVSHLDKTYNFMNSWGVLGKERSFTITYTKCMNGCKRDKHFISVMSDSMNWTFCIEELKWEKDDNAKIFFFAMNFIFYLEAFPECVIDGVPPTEKKTERTMVVSTSSKVISHTTTDSHGFVKPHFRSGYFRHYTSDHWVNCKGQVRFIAATMVKGKAKTVLTDKSIA